MDLYPEPGFVSKQHYFFLLVLCACSDSFLLLWAVHKCIHVGSTTVAMFRREDLQAQRIEICDIIFNEILNTATADMAGSASQCRLPRSHPGCNSKYFHPHVCPWNGSCPWASEHPICGGLFSEPQHLLTSLDEIVARLLQLVIRKEEAQTLHMSCFPHHLASCSSQSQKPAVMHFPASVPPRALSSPRIALLWLRLSFCNRRQPTLVFSAWRGVHSPSRRCLGNAGFLSFIFDRWMSKIQNGMALKGFVTADAVRLWCKIMLYVPASHLEWLRGGRQWESCFH